MATVILSAIARQQFDELRPPIRGRVAAVLERLAQWPRVSGAKPLRGDLAGNYRIRTGDYRLTFGVHAGQVHVARIALRRDVYEE